MHGDEQGVEQSWYNEDENSVVVDTEIKRFPKFKTRHALTSLNLAPSLSLQRQIDGDRWEDQQLSQSGHAFFKSRHKTLNDDEDENELRVCLHVTISKPDFLNGADLTKFQQKRKGQENYEGQLYQMAKNGSQSVADWKKCHEQQQEMRKMQQPKDKKLESTKTSGLSQYRHALSKTVHVNRTNLPIWNSRSEILRLVAENNVVVIVGETGSGKTTQLTQFLHDDGYSKFGQIACTQPRRVAAVSIARRVADEMGVVLGDEVGYVIRFEDVSSPKTLVKYMTDGVLLSESLVDPLLDRYSVIIMDEAHERSLNTDVLFGVLKGVLAKRNDLRVIVTSATMDSAKFSKYFGGCPVLNVSGRTFDVDISFMRSNPQDYVAAAVTHAFKVHMTEEKGDILIFMTGQDDVECTCELIRKKVEEHEGAPPIFVLPIYSQLPADLQARVFETVSGRKCIVATNIAETSLTIPGIRYVIDSGFAKQKNYSSTAGLDTLLVRPISQAAATQRSGRAGRTTDGKCWRLYSEVSYNIEMPPMTVPEIQRTNLAKVILLLKSMGFNDVLSFPFMDRPPVDNFTHALSQLWFLRAINNDGTLTDLGKEMAKFPLDPSLAKMLLMGDKFNCLNEVTIIVSMLSVPPVFYKPKGREEEADSKREKFVIPESDHLTLLNVFNLWFNVGKKCPSEKDREIERAKWAKENYLHNVSLVKANEVRKQLKDIADDAKLKPSSCGDDWTSVMKAVCSAYFHQIAQRKGLGEYVNLHTSVACTVHPASALAGLEYVPEYVVYHELVLTSKHYIHGVTAVDPLWLSEMAPEFFTATDIYGNVIGCRKEVDVENTTASTESIERPVGDVTTQETPVFVPQACEASDVILPEVSSEPKKRKRFGK